MRAPLKSLLATTGLLAFACTTTTDTGQFYGPPLEAPQTLESISLNQAVELFWADNAFTSDPTRFAVYRVYSTSYDLDAGLCGVSWEVEGTNVAPEFLVGALTNGVPRCYGVTVPEHGWRGKRPIAAAAGHTASGCAQRAGMGVRHQARFFRIPVLGRL